MKNFSFAKVNITFLPSHFSGQSVPSLWKSLPFISNRFTNSLTTPQDSNETIRQGVLENVNNLLQNQNEGRLFAVVHVCGKQFKITAGDIIIVEGYWPPTCGDKISLDKVDNWRPYF